MPMYCNNFELEESRDDFLLRAEPPEAFALYPSSNPGPPGPGVPAGGAAGQLLVKASGEDYDTEWSDADAGSITYDEETSYEDGTVGAELSSLNSEINTIQINKADVIVSSASGAIASFSDGMNAPIKDITINIEPVQSGSGEPSPTNVRPISGWIGANIERSGEAITFVNGGLTDTTGVEAANDARGRTDYIPYESGPLSVYMVNGRYDSTMRIRGFYFYDASKNFISNTISSLIPATLPYTYTEALPEGTKYIRICIQHAGGTATVVAENYSIAINPTTYPITFPSEAGTVYGGTLVLRMDGSGEWSGELTVDRVCKKFSALSWTYNSTYTRFNGTGVDDVATGYTARRIPFICSAYPAITDGRALGSVPNNSAYFGASQDQLFCVKTTDYTDPTVFVSSMGNETLVYLIDVPLVYTLTPEQVGAVITTLKGQNNVWSDVGSVSLNYRADTKLYIERLTAPTEDDLIANAPIASGKFFMIGNTLYLSTASIASGAQITIGTNAVKLSLADALNQINS